MAYQRITLFFLSAIIAEYAQPSFYVDARLLVMAPESLREIFQADEGEINTQMANFGHIPYGQSMSGRLHFNVSNPTGCNSDHVFVHDLNKGEDHYNPGQPVTPFFLVDHTRKCSFVRQTRNVERHGGSLALIIDDNETEDIKRVIMGDDGTGAGIRIPALLISKTDGEKLKNWMTHATPDELDKIQLQADFLIEYKQNEDVSLELWYTTSDDTSLDFIRNIAKYIEPLIQHVDLQPRFVTHACPGCDADYKRKNCLSNGKYCAMRHRANLDISGREILMENLRQYCIYTLSDQEEISEVFQEFIKKSTRTAYLEYMIRAHQVFRNRISRENSERVQDVLFLNTELINRCVNETFSQQNDTQADYDNDDNIVFRENAADWLQLGTHIYPSLTINEKTFRGRLTPDNAFEAICASFAQVPRPCLKWYNRHQIPVPQGRSSGVSQRVLFMYILVIIVMNTAIIIAYRMHFRKELKTEMQQQVNSAVSQYIALSNVAELEREGLVPEAASVAATDSTQVEDAEEVQEEVVVEEKDAQ